MDKIVEEFSQWGYSAQYYREVAEAMQEGENQLNQTISIDTMRMFLLYGKRTQRPTALRRIHYMQSKFSKSFIAISHHLCLILIFTLIFTLGANTSKAQAKNHDNISSYDLLEESFNLGELPTIEEARGLRLGRCFLRRMPEIPQAGLLMAKLTSDGLVIMVDKRVGYPENYFDDIYSNDLRRIEVRNKAHHNVRYTTKALANDHSLDWTFYGAARQAHWSLSKSNDDILIARLVESGHAHIYCVFNQ